MSISSENASLGSKSLKGKDPRSPSVIAEFNKRRLHGDYGLQPNAPTVGIRMDSGASTSAIKATSSQLGPKLWYPKQNAQALRASTLASNSSQSFIPEAHYVEDPKAASVASKAATSAIQVSGEEYGARHQPEAYNWGKKQSQWAHLGARSSAAAQRDEERLGGIDSLKRAPPTQSIDISKVLSAAQANAQQRLASADNHLPANFGIPTEEDKAKRRKEVLNLIAIADQRVKERLEEMNRDAQTPQNIFGSVEFQKIAMEVATRTHGGRLDNHGKLDLGGGLYMTPDEVNDIARRNVQPVLDKVQFVADKKRIADREAQEREAAAKQRAAEEKEAARLKKQEEKQRAAEEKQRRQQAETFAKEKRKLAQASSKEKYPEGSHLWHWQQVDIIKKEVQESKANRDAKNAELSRLKKTKEQAEKDLAVTVERHNDAKRDYFGRGEAIETKESEYDADAAETVSLFELKQQRETAKFNTQLLKDKRIELENKNESLKKQIEDLEKELEGVQKRHHELKKKYFEAREKAEEAEKQFQIEEEARLKREAEERAKREAEEAERKKRAAEEAERKKREESERKASAAKSTGVVTSSGAAANATSSSAAAPSGAASGSKAKAQSSSPSNDDADDLYTPPPKSKLLDLGDGRSGPVLSGYKTPAPAKKTTSKEASEETAEDAAKGASKDATKDTTDAAAVPATTSVSSTPGAEATAEETSAKEQINPSVEKEADKLDAAADAVVADKGLESKTEDSTTSAAAAAAATTTETPKLAVTSDASDAKKDTDKEETLGVVALDDGPTDVVPADTKEGATETPEAPKTGRTYEQVIKDEEAKAKATEEKVKESASSATETEESKRASKVSNSQAVGGDVAGSVVTGGHKTKLSDNIPLGDEAKDEFAGFDSSNVKEKVEDASPGVFKENF